MKTRTSSRSISDLPTRLPGAFDRSRRAAMSTAALFLAALLLVACSGSDAADDSGSGWDGTVTDSAGIPVVSNPSDGLWGPAEGWTVEEVISIGALEGEDAYQFGRIVAADRDSDGNFYVADQQAQEVRVFGPDGTHLRTLGEPGAGPGQLSRGVTGVFVHEGEVRVPDLGNQRLSRYSPDGEFIGSDRIDLAGGVPIRFDADGGRLVAQVRWIPTSDTADTSPKGDPIVEYGPDASVVDTLTVLPPGLSVRFEGGQARLRFFEAEPIWDLGPDGRLVSARNDMYRFEIRGPGGELQRVIRRDFESRPVTEHDKEVFLDAIRELAVDQGAPAAAVEAMFAQATFAEHYPAFASVLAGPQGTTWVQRIRTGEDLTEGEEGTFDPQDLGSNEWDVFDADGRYLGMTEFPGRFQPLRVVGDTFYGVQRDAMDVQRVVGYRVVR